MVGTVGITACQLRMARAALKWSIEMLAQRSDVSEKTIRRIEQVWGHPPNITLDTLNKLQHCCEEEGITFTMEDGSPEGPGIRFGRYPGRAVKQVVAAADTRLNNETNGHATDSPR